MALRQPLLNSVDVVDVVSVLDAFEVLNSCHLTVEVHVEQGRVDTLLVVEMRAWVKDCDKLAVQPLASLKQMIGLSAPRTLEAVILQGLYGLDAQLAEGEFARVIKG